MFLGLQQWPTAYLVPFPQFLFITRRGRQRLGGENSMPSRIASLAFSVLIHSLWS